MVTVIKPLNNFCQGTHRKANQLLLKKKCDTWYMTWQNLALKKIN